MKKKLGEIAKIRSGYTFRDGLTVVPTGSVLVFQAKDVYAAGELERLPAIAFDNSKHFLQNGTVLLSIRGSFKAGVVRTGGRPSIATSSVIVMDNIHNAVEPEYLALYFNSTRGQEQLMAVATGAAIQTLTKAELQNIPVPIPPPETQRLLIGLEANIRDQKQLLETKQQLLHTILSGANAKATKESR